MDHDKRRQDGAGRMTAKWLTRRPGVYLLWCTVDTHLHAEWLMLWPEGWWQSAKCRAGQGQAKRTVCKFVCSAPPLGGLHVSALLEALFTHPLPSDLAEVLAQPQASPDNQDEQKRDRVCHSVSALYKEGLASALVFGAHRPRVARDVLSPLPINKDVSCMLPLY